MPLIQVNLGRVGSAVCESDGTLVAFFAEHSAALAACAPGQIVVPCVITKSGIIPTQPEQESSK